MSRSSRTRAAEAVAEPASSAQSPTADNGMSHRQVLEALSGLILGMFVSILASTVVSSSLPLIISDLKGDQSSFTWVVTATLLATTVSTPIWGKLADLFSRKLLIQIALVIFVLGSAFAGFSQDTTTLIVFRVMQGLGAGGLGALSQIIMADIISPRERGKYAGLFGGVMAVGMVGGPLLGGVVTDAFGWRWNFFLALPIAIVAIVLLQMTLHLPKIVKRAVKIDYLGAIFIAGGVSLLLIWVSLAGSQFEWASATSFVMVAGAAALLIAAVITEFKVKEPIIPLQLFKNRTFTLSVIASISIGVAMFGTSVFLSQYMQLARGATPTQSGLLTIPMMGGLLLASAFFGNIVSRTGKWKAIMVTGSALAVVGLALLSTIHYDTNFWFVGISMFVLGSGVGMVMQNLTLVVQNTTEVKNLGVATSAVTFFRSLGGTMGVSILGSIMGTLVADSIKDGITDLSPENQLEAAKTLGSGVIPHVDSLPDAIRVLVESSYGSAVGSIFLLAVPLAVITLIAVAFLPNNKLGTMNAIDLAKKGGTAVDAETEREREIENAEDSIIEAAAATAGLPAVGEAHPVGTRTGSTASVDTRS
ncbi:MULTISPECIES: MDR family MFS transporter [unclassified Leifsonia]|uniref:MDR family MFS transporter n=1 Tax=unclassified Leifsonia TaxID=2663824 RepID=UPI000B18676E|nr:MULTISPECIES: MDR family MFS transporter [unclassified Leifsonia]